MSLVMRRSRPDDYSVIWKEPDGRERYIGRIFHDPNGISRGGKSEWFWGVDFFQQKGRSSPYQGRADNLDDAKIAWRRCWDSADAPIDWPP